MVTDFEKSLSKLIIDLSRNVNELLWATTFHDAVKGCEWFPSEKFSMNLGRWAVGYNYYYVVFRVLNEFKPKNILETGLGQSTRLIGQYVKTHEGCRHNIVEHDADFARVSQGNFSFSRDSKFNIIPITKKLINFTGSTKGIVTYTMKTVLKMLSTVKSLISFLLMDLTVLIAIRWQEQIF